MAGKKPAKPEPKKEGKGKGKNPFAKKSGKCPHCGKDMKECKCGGKY